MEEILATKLGRAALALTMTIVVLVALYKGETGGRFNVKHEDSETAFGCSIVGMALVTLGLWISVLF
jgi:hypothetical protein